MASNHRSGISRASVRPPVRQVKSSLARHGSTASRLDRSGAISPAESVSSATTTATTGTKRKEREFESDEGGESTNINVVVRCRGRNDREVKENSTVVVKTDGSKGSTVELSMGPNALSNKTYNFDRVFSPAADQSMVFDEVVKPILDEVISGFNCTIFAYGQTGTGKTYTMHGDMTESFGMMSDAAGIIPRVLNALFHKLEDDETESAVRCSFIELYNEELRDLLSADDGKLKIYDDNSRKGHATTVVQGMEERHITSATDGLKWLQQGSVRRQVAATKCNDLSSRSHTVFTININIKRTGEDGEEYLSAGKLNLVDLAGSENIQRSGAENKRAAEAGLINKSLLTLGRVINALVDRSSHIPYRESKLTRLLQDSLGGRTKTCIIATISPAKSNLEETISTLDYAFRAKNIKNKPQVNAMINKKTLLREFSAEIEKLKGELIATRQRNGVYLSNEDYEEITAQNESRRILTDEQAAKIETLEHNLRNKVQDLFTLNSSFMGLKKDHEGTKAQLDETKDVLDQTELVLAATRKMLAEETHIRKAHQQTEEKLSAVGGELLTTLKQTVEDVGGLRAKNKRKSDLQMLNRSTWGMSQSQVADVTELVERRIDAFRDGQEQHIEQVSRRMEYFVGEELRKLTSTQKSLDEQLAQFAESRQELLQQKERSKDDMDNVLEEIKVVRDIIKERFGESLQAIAAGTERLAADVLSELDTFHNQLQTSYSSLGKDFKTIFEDMVRSMDAQKNESDRLRRQLEGTGDDIVQSNEAISAQIREVVEQERKQAAEERQQLLSQIASLITSQAERQETRLAGKTALLQKSMSETNSTFQEGMAQFSTGMDAWNEKESELVAEVNKSKTAMKKKMKDDWTAANETSTLIQNTTKSVHQETVRVVDEQLKDLDIQMRDLDDFVTRARAENSEHHEQHARSVEGLTGTVKESFSNISHHFVETYDRVRDLGEEMDTATNTLKATLPPLEEEICRPLSILREDINNTVLREYEPTGETPQKLKYEYPTTLPRTEPHEVLLAGLQDDLPPPTPTKLCVSGTSTTTVPTIFNDLDMLPPLPPTKSGSPPPTSLPTLQPQHRNPLAMSLREVNPNLTTGSIMLFDPSASTMSMPPPANENKTLPLFKRSVSGIKPVTRTRRRNQTTDNLGEGRENVPPAGGEMGGLRRKSPRLN
ncbi:kinesin motor domain-containing protein [Coniochaeta ligniaria NRRL 30616]|uniref:Kinesin motor domain-containing protein n=1 Tax=Coniochaeta ligniaria NRRL 30616 TaxID=1408157 RepID=A0A1J7IS91_9PEZI|nr:kinesin motor domain-containing protein [Coniochaeta ligniaria NRRL 30616]